MGCMGSKPAKADVSVADVYHPPPTSVSLFDIIIILSLHGEYLRELRELAGEGAPPPRLFVMGRYVGGAEECGRLAESGKLREMMRWAKARGEACSFSATKDGRGCLGCGGARFVPCWECGGSCKVVVHGDVDRCAKCNENGLMMCPICH